ncbi:MAG: EthD domain-containing protein [Spongiibacteraceae bacterium]
MKRKPGLTHEQFRDRYESGHAPLAVQQLPHLRNFIKPVRGWEDPDFDCVTEFWFDDENGWKETSKSYVNSDVGKILIADEDEFMDRGSMRMLIADERVSEINRG